MNNVKETGAIQPGKDPMGVGNAERKVTSKGIVHRSPRQVRTEVRTRETEEGWL